MARALGVGGIFFKSPDPVGLQKWYAERLGISVQSEQGMSFAIFQPGMMPENGYTVWSAFDSGTAYFAPSSKEFMFNLVVDNLEEALSQVAETRRTALGLVMNLGSDYLKFDFDKAELHPSDRELLSRVAGILLTSPDYSVSVNGHTDDVGTEEYNQQLSERRAQAVRDYLVKAGLPPAILSVTGHGKKRPLLPGSSEKARAKNRRVELGIVNTRILYGRPGVTSGETRFQP